jgi:hypothetical protein
VRVVVVLGRFFYEGFPALRRLKAQASRTKASPINKPIPLRWGQKSTFF